MAQNIWTIQAALDWTRGYLERKGDAHGRLSAEWLLGAATGLSRIELYTNYEQPLSLDERATLREYVSRRAGGEPLQYITNEAAFRYLTLTVRPGVLIPRPETEVLVSEALRLLDEQTSQDISPSILDVGTGSGCIACSIAWERPQVSVMALDCSSEALSLAQENIERLGLQERVQALASDLLNSLEPDLKGSFDLIVSNPPYIPTEVLGTLDEEVSAFEPRLALDGGEDGLDIFRKLLPQAWDFLKGGGSLAVELHETSLDDAADFARSQGFQILDLVNDLAGKPRILLARKPV